MYGKMSAMNYADYLRNLAFRLIEPHFQLPVTDQFFEERLQYILKTGRTGLPEKFGIFLEMINTVIPHRGLETRKSFLKLSDTPRMSTLAIAALINEAVTIMPQSSVFVNVGVWHGFSFLSGLINNPEKTCVGVDNFSEFGGPKDYFMERFMRVKSSNHFFHDMDYKDYFRDVHKDSIGFYFYDGNHSYENQMEGLKVAEPFFCPGCIVLVDDTNWAEPYQATMDFVKSSQDSYRTLLDVKTKHNCHPTFWNGVLVIQRT